MAERVIIVVDDESKYIIKNRTHAFAWKTQCRDRRKRGSILCSWMTIFSWRPTFNSSENGWHMFSHKFSLHNLMTQSLSKRNLDAYSSIIYESYELRRLSKFITKTIKNIRFVCSRESKSLWLLKILIVKSVHDFFPRFPASSPPANDEIIQLILFARIFTSTLQLQSFFSHKDPYFLFYDREALTTWACPLTLFHDDDDKGKSNRCEKIMREKFEKFEKFLQVDDLVCWMDAISYSLVRVALLCYCMKTWVLSFRELEK